MSAETNKQNKQNTAPFHNGDSQQRLETKTKNLKPAQYFFRIVQIDVPSESIEVTVGGGPEAEACQDVTTQRVL